MFLKGCSCIRLELEILGKIISEVSEENYILDISLSDTKTELEELRAKLKHSEESCQAHPTDNSALSAQKINKFLLCNNFDKLFSSNVLSVLKFLLSPNVLCKFFLTAGEHYSGYECP
jgi:hypothetical protein